MRRFCVLVAALTVVCAGVFKAPRVGAQARPQRAVADASANGASDAAALYEEAAGYMRRKVNEAQQSGAQFDQAKVAQEGREVALKHAATLAARGPLKGADLYYLGLLYNLAAKPEAALDAMRRYLSENANAPAHMAQMAHQVSVIQAVKLNQLEEAEKSLAAYARVQPQKPGERYRLENMLAGAYYQKNRFDLAAPHALESYKAAKLIEDRRNWRQRDDRLLKAATLVSESYTRANKRAEAVAALHDLRRHALSIPSSELYGNALSALRRHGETYSPKNNAFADATGVTPAPELVVSEWIDQQPAKLSDLRGRVVLLDFWATWCGPCLVTIPKLNTLHKKYKDKGLVIVGLTRFEGNAEGQQMTPAEELNYLRQFKKRFGVGYGYAVAETAENSLNYGITALPSAVVIDRRGVVRHFILGVYTGSHDELTATVEKLLEEQ